MTDGEQERAAVVAKGLTENQIDVLTEIAWRTESNDFGMRGQGQFTPLDLGGHDCSHHSATLAALVKKGLVEHRKLGREWGDAPTRYRGSKVYRASPFGLVVRQHLRGDHLTDRPALAPIGSP